MAPIDSPYLWKRKFGNLATDSAKNSYLTLTACGMILFDVLVVVLDKGTRYILAVKTRVINKICDF